ncbi:MAG: N-acetylmuramoyl-L-alanine amidase [Deltaproteobacteria bacterium]|nr:N-acetylmuramoyl-L-alanine amidase [Deltaproteobacteria bacterium]
MEYQKLYLTNNECFKREKEMTPTGIVVHSTGVNNPYLRRYIGPDDGVLGPNPGANHWNQPNIKKCVHGFIGYDKDKQVRCYNTLPWHYRSWGCAKGPKGSFNKSHIQFEICEDDLLDGDYFNDAFSLAIDLCAHLCDTFGISVERIVSHKEAFRQGFASDHGDPHTWLKKHDWTMDDFRRRVFTKIQNNQC